MPDTRVVVTGMGIISPLGKGVTSNHKALVNNQHGLGDITILRTKHSGSLPAGEIKLTNQELAAKSRQQGHQLPRSVLLSFPAIREAIDSAQLSDHRDMNFYYSTTVGGMDISEDLNENRLKGEEIDYSGFQYHDCGASTALLAEYFGFKGRRYSLSTACSSSANCIGRAAMDIKSGRARYALAGGADALCRFTLNGFNSLMILDKELCNPMDQNRRGLNLGEAAAFLILESEENALKRGAEILAIVSGFGNTNDSHHQTASSEDGKGAVLAIREALRDAQLEPEDISYVNAHGTGTQNNDLSEGNALQTVFGKVPPTASTKSFTGHTLAASGAVEAIFSILAIKHQQMFPSLRYKEKISGLKFESFDKTMQGEVNHVLSNAFGFGGNCSALIFSKY